ncbi:MAG: TonB-dependent receptor [Saprospiraceae bacterium]
MRITIISLNWNNDKNKDLKYYFETKLFYNHIFNMITLVQVDPNNELFYRNENIGDFKSKGIEFNFGLRYKVYWNFKAGYGYTGSNSITIMKMYISTMEMLIQKYHII